MKTGGLRSGIALCIGIGTLALLTANTPAYGATQQPSKEPALPAPQKPVSVWVTVLDKQGQPVDDLKKEDFRVLEDGKEQAITSFNFGVRQPFALGLLMQWSGMRTNTLPYGEIGPAIEFFHELMGKDDFSFVAKFTGKVDSLIDFTNDPSEIERALRYAEAVRPWGEAALYDSIIWACSEKLSTRPQRRILLLVIDGRDNASMKSLRDVIESALRSETTIYVVSLSYANPFLAGDAATGQSSHKLQLKGSVHVEIELAEQTGGDAIFVRKEEDLAPAFTKVERELRNQYLLGYSPVNEGSRREFRKIKIEVKRKGVRVLARSGYYVSIN